MKKILIINRLGIGDVVLTTPLAQAIKELFSAHIGFVVSTKAVDILQNHPYIDEVFGYRHPSKRAMLEQLRNGNYDEALIVDERFSSTLLALKAGCRLLNKGFEISIGKRRFFSRRYSSKRAIDNYSSYLKYLNPEGEIPCLPPTLGIPDTGSKQKIEQWLHQHQFNNKKLMLIAARGLSDNKNWPCEYFAVLNGYLNKRGITPVYLGSSGDHEYIEAIHGIKINAAGYFNLREVAAIAQYAALSLTMCTGAMHVIATAKTPILAVYGPTSAERWAPSHACVLQADISCVPCQRLGCTNDTYKQCMLEITPQQVIDKIEAEKWLT
ncbi:glycosyltransferase family 9 protein [Anaerospora sp.]|uniref:glycosyltransferase family 9 protein n=1 Tax=Anaerospora sp. TaxID=1960278 RepID=UPI00289FB71F|nr:glycosyltransferase family 9 protein [Anaerospora sp.]